MHMISLIYLLNEKNKIYKIVNDPRLDMHTNMTMSLFLLGEKTNTLTHPTHMQLLPLCKP